MPLIDDDLREDRSCCGSLLKLDRIRVRCLRLTDHPEPHKGILPVTKRVLDGVSWDTLGKHHIRTISEK